MADLVCACAEEFRSACKGLPADNEHEGKQYCVLHFPNTSKDSGTQFQAAVHKKLEGQDYDFGGVYFPDSFEACASLELQGKANFSGATFMGRASFGDVHFKRLV